MKQITRLLVILTLSMSLSGCIYYKITHLSDEDLAWFDAYEEGDSLLFESNYGGKDTIVIKDKGIENSLNPFYISTGNSGHMQACAYYYFNDCLITNFFVAKSVKSDSVCVWASLKRRYTDFKKEIFLHPMIKTIKVNGKEYDGSIIFDSSNTIINFYDDLTDEYDIKEFAWNKKLGLLYYEYDNGERYVFKGKINK